MTLEKAITTIVAYYGKDFDFDDVYSFCENFGLDFTPHDFGLTDEF